MRDGRDGRRRPGSAIRTPALPLASGSRPRMGFSGRLSLTCLPITLKMNHRSPLLRTVPSMIFHNPSKSIGNGAPPRRGLGLVGLVAVLAMVFAGPSHLWLVHGGSHGQQEVEQSSSSGCQGHHHACGGHGHADHEGEDGDRDEPRPCDSTADDCDACTALGASKPIELAEGMSLDEFRFVGIDTPSDRSAKHAWRPGSGIPRGPPSIA